MSGLERRNDKQARKPAHAQSPDPARAPQPAPPPLPQRPQAAPVPEPKQTAPQPDQLAAVLMALAGKTPQAMPETLAWTRAGGVTVLPTAERRAPGQADLRAQLATAPQVRADAVLEALTGRRGQLIATRDAEALWQALVAATTAGATVLAGGDDDAPKRPHDRARVVQVLAVAETDAARLVTIRGGDGAETALPLAELAREFATIAVSQPD